jgi:ABC-type glycerol-3-phosphate transport system permease component
MTPDMFARPRATHTGFTVPSFRFEPSWEEWFFVCVYVRTKGGTHTSSIRAEAYQESEVSILSVEAELKRTLRRLNILMIVLAIELIPIALVAVYFLVMMLSIGSGPSD